MAVEVKLKRWGNSMAVVVPIDVVENQSLKENDSFFIEIVKKADLTEIFNSIKKRKMSGQEFKDIVRAGWKE